MTLSIFQIIAFLLASIVFVITPGPGVFAAIANAMAHGACSVLPLAFGMALGDVVYMVLSVYGLSTLATHFHEVFMVIRFIGAAYLFYLAWKLWTSTPAMTMESDAAMRKKDGVYSVLSGFLISISNPKVILFYISLLPSFFPVTTLNHFDTVIICLLVLTAVMIGIMAYAVLAGQAKKQLKSPMAQRVFNRISASLMAGAGTWLVTKG